MPRSAAASLFFSLRVHSRGQAAATRRGGLAAFVAVPTIAACLLAAPTFGQLASIETQDLRLIYFDPSETFLTPHAGRTFQNSMAFQKRVFGWQPHEKVTVLLTDFADYGNASATSIPRNQLAVQIAPLSFAYETMPANERMNTLMNHELVHVVQMDEASRGDRFFRRSFFGKVNPVAEQPETVLYLYLTAPRVASPRWYLEGGAVFFDTWMAGGIGRAQGGYDEMVFRSMVRDKSRFYDPLGLVSEGTKVDFQTEANSYLYGTRFMTYLAQRYSPQHVVRWMARTDGSRAYYASAFEQVFGEPLRAAWRDWIGWEHDFQSRNLEAIARYPTTPFEDLSRRALGSVSRAFLDAEARKLYGAFNYPGQVGHIGAISLDTGSVEKIVDVKGPTIYIVTSVAFDPESRTIFYTADNNAYRDLMAVDPRTKRVRRLLKDARIGDLVFDRSDKSLWGIRHLNGICSLVRIPHPYRDWNRVFSWPYGEVPYDIDLSPDGRLLSASVGEISGRHTLRVMKVESLLSGDATPLSETEFAGSVPSNFVFSPDGRYLFGSSYYTGASNVFRFEIETRALEAVSNTETGFFRPLPLDDERLIVFRYSGEGFLPARIEARPLADVSPITLLGQELAERSEVVREWKIGSPAAIPFDSMVVRRGPYRPASNLRLESAYPVVAGYKDTFAFGMRLNFSEPLQLNRANLTVSVSPGGDLSTSERVHARGEYYRDSWNARFRYNPADFYDLFGPTKTSRKGYSGGLGWEKVLVYDRPRQLEARVWGDYWGGLERLPDYQNVPTTADKLFSARQRLRYRNVRSSIGHVDDEKGWASQGVLLEDVVEGKAYVRGFADLDLGFALPIGHSSLWLRNSAGASHGDREQPYSYFFFGGFGNNWVDHGDEKRYREQYSFPGAELNEVPGRNYVKSMLEWNLPPIRFRGVGSPGFYLTWARPALFAVGLVTDLDRPGLRRELGSAGGQIDFRFGVLSALDVTLSVGYAVAFEDGFRPRHEGMVSLKLLR